MAEKWSEKAADLADVSDYYLTYATILFANDNSESALRIAKRARELAVIEKQSTEEIDILLRTIKPQVLVNKYFFE